MNIKKLPILLFILIALLALVGCNDENDETKKEYTVIWENYDGEILEVDNNVLYGTIPSYDGEIPMRELSEGISYIFNGWSPEITKVEKDITYKALYTETLNKYTVTWVNYNDEVLEIDYDVVYGSIPHFDGTVPTKDENNGINYVFSGWTPNIEKVESDVTYKAIFIESFNKYTITWKNYNGEVLELDIDVAYGEMPEYNGVDPVKESNGAISYVFVGWTPTIGKVQEDMTYVATFNEVYEGEDILGMKPVISQDGKTILYGLYPQTHVNDSQVITQLNTLEPSSINGWYLYNGEYYAKQKAIVYNNESYKFDDGTAIVSGEEYWFKCEPIKWQILKNNDGSYFLLSTLLLDAHNYYADYSSRIVNEEIIYANNYQYSDIRKWLNNEFYNTAFAFNSANIIETIVCNDALTTNSSNNKYVCNDTKDKVYLPSFQDYLNTEYGFDSNSNDKSVTRESKTTDYARARGAWCNIKTDLGTGGLYNGSYWTRSCASEFYYCAWNVNSGGYLSSYTVDGINHSVRPCIEIKIIE